RSKRDWSSDVCSSDLFIKRVFSWIFFLIQRNCFSKKSWIICVMKFEPGMDLKPCCKLVHSCQGRLQLVEVARLVAINERKEGISDVLWRKLSRSRDGQMGGFLFV